MLFNTIYIILLLGEAFYYNIKTCRSTWEKPSWIRSLDVTDPPNGWTCYIPEDDPQHKPLYVNHYTKESQNDPPRGFHICYECNYQFSTKLCPECENNTYCDMCFEYVHAEKTKLKHTWEGIKAVEIRCSECYKKATLKCIQCNDNYCDRCSSTFHLNGNRALHVLQTIGFHDKSKSIQKCVDCNKQASHICDTCKDEYCYDCFQNSHKKGKRAFHKPLEL